MSDNMSGSDSDSDFGNFSDASIEQEVGEKPTEQVIEQCLDTLFGPTSAAKDDDSDDDINSNPKLIDLLKEERPHVIYEQLFSGRVHYPPFIWKHSHIRSTMLSVLGLPPDTDAKENATNSKQHNEPLDDSLYIQLCSVIDKDKLNTINGTTMVLRDHFKYKYTPGFHIPGSLDEEGDELGKNHKETEKILQLLNGEFDHNDLQKYHDELCNAVDSQVIKLKALTTLQQDLLNDKTTFESVVTNLSGHTQRLQRDEIALYNKKMGKHQRISHLPSSSQRKRFSWVGL